MNAPPKLPPKPPTPQGPTRLTGEMSLELSLPEVPEAPSLPSSAGPPPQAESEESLLDLAPLVLDPLAEPLSMEGPASEEVPSDFHQDLPQDQDVVAGLSLDDALVGALSGLPAVPSDNPFEVESMASSSSPVSGPLDDAAEVLGTVLGEALPSNLGLGSEPVAAAAAEEDSFQPVAGADEVKTLQRFAGIKEREAREKDAALQAVNRQLEQVRERLLKSEAERRRVTLALDESEVNRRALQDDRDQARHAVGKLEAAHQDELRALQLRVDNAQFQASRAERKLEEFRERVKSDIQKIRIRERELANRLELQKRDAEALLSAKDERLLQQKREIDRLEFELDTLRERLLEQTQQAEERVSRLSRALKALKMAQGMLSGIEDEVLPNVGEKSRSDGGGEEAA